jgi:hypothetical protein
VVTLGGVSEPGVLPELEGYPAIMTGPEVGEVLRLAPDVVSRLMSKGKLPGVKAGGVWRARRADVQAVILGTWTPRSPQPLEGDAAPT